MKVKSLFAFTFVKRDSLEVTPPFIVQAFTLEHAERKLRVLLPKDIFDVHGRMQITNSGFICVPAYCTLDLDNFLNKKSIIPESNEN